MWVVPTTRLCFLAAVWRIIYPITPLLAWQASVFTPPRLCPGSRHDALLGAAFHKVNIALQFGCSGSIVAIRDEGGRMSETKPTRHRCDQLFRNKSI